MKKKKNKTLDTKSLAVIVFITGSVLLLSLGFEFLFRMAHYQPSVDEQYSSFVADADIGHRAKPFSVSKGISASKEFEFEYIHNSLGFRDTEHLKEKPLNTYRILALGDSFTYGAGVDFSQTYLQKLKQELQKTSPQKTFELINLATTYSFPELELKTFQKYGTSFSPDLVLVGFLPNDIVDINLASDSITTTADGHLSRGGVALNPLEKWLGLHSQIWRQIRYLIFQFSTRLYWKDLYFDLGLNQKAWEKAFHDFKNLDKLVQKSNARLAIVYIPQKGPWKDRHALPEKILKKWAESQDILFIPTFEKFRTASHQGLKTHWDDDQHCTALGNQIVATAVAEKIKSLR